MNTPRPPLTVALTWDGDLRFSGQSGDVRLALDGESTVGPSPMQALAFSLAACMAIDVVTILLKGRHGVRGLRTSLTAQRADAQPACFVGLALHLVIDGAIPAEAIERAIDLSREKYCSVWHSLRQDIELSTTYEVVSPEIAVEP